MDVATIDHLLTSTRSVRRRLDLTRAVEPDVIARCLDIAVQAPAGGNLARYHFVVVTDRAKRSEIATLYKRAFLEDYVPRRKQVRAPFPEAEAGFFESATYLAEHLHEVPVHIIPCFEGRVEEKGTFWQASMYGCILPVTWSLMLALRARGLGSSLTTLHLIYEVLPGIAWVTPRYSDRPARVSRGRAPRYRSRLSTAAPAFTEAEIRGVAT